MILYFSGTGNSRWVARRMAEILGDELVDIGARIKAGDTSGIAARRLVVVSPVYAWRLPRVVEQWLRAVAFEGNPRVWFVLTCGDGIGNADRYLRSLCRDKGFDYMGVQRVLMPENYIALFPVPDAKAARRIIGRAAPVAREAAGRVLAGKPFTAAPIRLGSRLCSGVVNAAFYRFIIHAKPFRVTEQCVGCGECARRCVLNNIRMEDGKPRWGDRCTHCMACICLCPKRAIEYGKRSVGKPRYRAPEC